MAEYSPYKMKGHSLPGPNQKQSPAKQDEDLNVGPPKDEKPTLTHEGEHTKSKSPAKCPLVAALAPIAMQMMNKKKEINLTMISKTTFLMLQLKLMAKNKKELKWLRKMKSNY